MITTFDLLVAHPFLAGMPLRHLEHLSQWATRAPFSAGSRIFQEHGQAQGFWLIRMASSTSTSGRAAAATPSSRRLGPARCLGGRGSSRRIVGISAR
jgi:hypothetical protein